MRCPSKKWAVKESSGSTSLTGFFREGYLSRAVIRGWKPFSRETDIFSPNRIIVWRNVRKEQTLLTRKHVDVKEDLSLPMFLYSSMVFFSPTLKPSVCSGSRS
jgi:hypothetical protein